MSSPPALPQKPTRSDFIMKLWDLLENPYQGEALRWAGDDAFEISSNDGKARHALSPKWEFKSLSSFIRQLSYYGFRRLSDRRRSSERRGSSTGMIVFSHPSGYFTRGDNSNLEGIIRKLRSRPEKGSTRRGAGRRRASAVSSGSMEALEEYSPPPAPLHLPLPPVTQGTWQAPDFRPQFGDERRPLNTFLPAFQSNFAHYTPTNNSMASTSNNNNGAAARHTDISTWRAYTPATSSWQPASSNPHNTAPYDRYANNNRRSSIPDLKFAPSISLPPLKESFAEERPRLRKAASSLCIQTTHQNDFRTSTSPYPTPTISPAWNSYFSITGTQLTTAEQQCPPQSASHLTYTPYVPPSASNNMSGQYTLQQQAPPSPSASDSAPHSPPHASYAPIGLDPRQLIHPVSPRTGGYYEPMNPQQHQHHQQQQLAEAYFNDNQPPRLGDREGWQSQAQVAGAY